MIEKIYEFEKFKEMLEYLGYELVTILDFEEYYQNLNIPLKNLEDFFKWYDER